MSMLSRLSPDLLIVEAAIHSTAQDSTDPPKICRLRSGFPFSLGMTLKRLLLLAGLMLVPMAAHAHAAGAAVNGWHDGFNHPLHGWDHLVVMIAVGLWAAQQRGRSVWLIPLTFVGVMTLGGIVGVTGIMVPGVELAILLSV